MALKTMNFPVLTIRHSRRSRYLRKRKKEEYYLNLVESIFRELKKLDLYRKDLLYTDVKPEYLQNYSMLNAETEEEMLLGIVLGSDPDIGVGAVLEYGLKSKRPAFAVLDPDKAKPFRIRDCDTGEMSVFEGHYSMGGNCDEVVALIHLNK